MTLMVVVYLQIQAVQFLIAVGALANVSLSSGEPLDTVPSVELGVFHALPLPSFGGDAFQ